MPPAVKPIAVLPMDSAALATVSALTRFTPPPPPPPSLVRSAVCGPLSRAPPPAGGAPEPYSAPLYSRLPLASPGPPPPPPLVSSEEACAALLCCSGPLSRSRAPKSNEGEALLVAAAAAASAPSAAAACGAGDSSHSQRRRRLRTFVRGTGLGHAAGWAGCPGGCRAAPEANAPSSHRA